MQNKKKKILKSKKFIKPYYTLWVLFLFIGKTTVEVGLLRRAFGGHKGLSLRHLRQTVLAHAVAIDCVCRMPRWRVCVVVADQILTQSAAAAPADGEQRARARTLARTLPSHVHARRPRDRPRRCDYYLFT